MVKTPNRPHRIPRAAKGLFLAGTDTNVGKTVATAALAVALRRTGGRVGVMKPVETGAAQEPVASASDARRLRDLCTPHENMELLNPYRFPAPVAPMAAAQRAQRHIELPVILNAYQTLAGRYDYMLVEGVGGVLVPLTPAEDVCGLIKLMDIPCLIVSRTGLGAINHTRLTLMGLRQSGIPVAGVLLNHTGDAGGDAQIQTESTVALIRTFSDVPVFGPLPFQPDMALRWENGVNALADDAAMRDVAKMVRESD